MPHDPLQDELVRRAMARDAGQTIGPMDPRTTLVSAEREDPFAGKELLQSWAENVIDPSNWGLPGGGAVSTPLHAVAAGGPKNIPKLKAAGEALIKQITESGMLPRAFGKRVLGAEGETLNEKALQALRFAQQRYPRLFGHLADVTPIDQSLPQGYRGRSAPSQGIEGLLQGARPDEARKISRIELNQYSSNPNTIGHELLHAADRITMPDFDKAYDATLKLPSVVTESGRVAKPYEASSYEIRARNAGESFNQKLRKELEKRAIEDQHLIDAGIIPK